MRKRIVRLGFLGSATVAVLVAMNASTHAASPIPAAQVSQVRLPPATAQCKYTDALPALPAGCAAPTLANCTDGNWFKTGCGANKAVDPKSAHPTTPIIQQYCHKILVDDFCKDTTREELSAPPDGGVYASPHSVLKPATIPSTLFQPPGKKVFGRQVLATPLAGRGGGKAPATVFNSPTSQIGGPYAVTASAGASAGTFESLSLANWVPQYNSARPHQANIHAFAMKNLTAQAASDTDAIFANLLTSSYVGNGTVNAANLAVNSCYEFAYQRWYDYERFKLAAKALGPNYRAIYNLAFSNEYNLEKATLKQFGYGNLPKSWPKDPNEAQPWEAHIGKDYQTKLLPRNPFWTNPTFAADVPAATQQAIVARLAKFPANKQDLWYIKLPPGQDTSRFALHKAMEKMIDRKYHLSDDGFRDRRARMRRYAELIESRNKLAAEIACGQIPDLCCSGTPYYNGGASNKVLDEIRGVTVINPDPTKIANTFADIGTPSSYGTFEANDRLNLETQSILVKNNAATAKAGMKRKTVPVGKQLTAVASTPVKTPIGSLTCQQKAVALGHAAEIAIEPVKSQLSKLVVAEFAVPDGCLEDPGSDLGNSCDWSYELFDHMLMTYFDEDAQSDYHECNKTSKGDFKRIRDPEKQDKIVWPCELRHDFGVDQLDTQYYIDAVHQRAGRYGCEVKRSSDAVQSYLDQYRDLLDQIPINGDGAGESAGDEWTLGDPTSFGAHAKYDLDWKVYGGMNDNRPKIDGAWCHPDGSAHMSAEGDIAFFWQPKQIFSASSGEQTEDAKTFYHARVSYDDMEHGTVKLIDPPVADHTAYTGPLDMPLDGPQLLGDLRYDVWFSVGPIPIHIFFGANASSGMDLRIDGKSTDAKSCATPSKPIEQVPLGFKMENYFEPWAEADAYADASIDIFVASAGIRMDLTLLRLGLPVGTKAETEGPGNLKLDTGCHLTTDALNGSVSAYVDVGIWPLELSFEATLFSWDGLHSDTTLFGTGVTAPLKAVSWAAEPLVTDATCRKGPNTAKPKSAKEPQPLNGTAAIVATRPICLKDPTAAACAPFAPPKPYLVNGIKWSCELTKTNSEYYTASALGGPHK